MKVMAETAEAKSKRKGQHYHKYDELEPVDTSSAPFMKSLGAKWLVRMSEQFISNPSIDFFGAGIQQSIDACKPFVEVDEPANDQTESDEIESEENYDEEDFQYLV